MKKIILSSILLAAVLVSCNQKNKEEQTPNSEVETVTKTVETEAVEEITAVSDAVKASLSTEAIINGYLKIKNALANDKSKEATAAANDFEKAVSATNSSKIDSKLIDKYTTITESAKKQASLIATNDGKIVEQRIYFAVLSKDVTSLIAAFGTSKKLYQDYCPMYDQGKSGYWISEIKEIRNPYYGSEMLTCGGMIKEIK
ncbi:DUF3347 domain-containing protein [Flavobacterium sp. FZUC8N2.13]|uniref:DUF3347 domain-containing protein n=1 Tax=Flavobacterium zubiriense TaxID=3138075 RepID=A0ABV4TD43_9FLAO